MIDWQRHCPTFVKWRQQLARSRLAGSLLCSTARDAWRGTERLCVIEVGRGVRRLSLWQVTAGVPKLLASRDRAAVDQVSLGEELSGELRALGAEGLPCELLFNPPWAAAKVFVLTSTEAVAPDRWIAQYRAEVFPPGMEEDLRLGYKVFPRTAAGSVLVVGLIRRSAVARMEEALREVGGWPERIVIGPLATLERSLPVTASESALLLDHTGPGSVGCWLWQQGMVRGWAEIPSAGSQGGEEQLRESSLYEAFGSWLPGNEEMPPAVEVPAFRPLRSKPRPSRWLFPRPQPESTPAAIIMRTAKTRSQVAEQWAGWVLRWVLVIVAASVLLGLIGQVASAIAMALRGTSANETAALQGRRARLETERERLERKLGAAADPGAQNSAAGRLWFDLGVTRPESVWLRAIKLQGPGSPPGKPHWQLEGLSLDRNGPEEFSAALAKRSRWQARVTRLEKVDPAKSRDAPPALKRDLFRFAIEVTR